MSIMGSIAAHACSPVAFPDQLTRDHSNIYASYSWLHIAPIPVTYKGNLAWILVSIRMTWKFIFYDFDI
ncbi:MAG: hypothetical protein LUC91_10780 [Prevotella sp.]|nr:hypothetical protein [Prevotella sp.]